MRCSEFFTTSGVTRVPSEQVASVRNLKVIEVAVAVYDRAR